MTARTTHPNAQAAGPGRMTESHFSTVPVQDLVLWFALGAMLVHAVPSMIRLGGPPWALPPVDQVQAWYWTSAFLAGAFGLTMWRVVRGGASLPRLLAMATWPWLPGLAALMIRDGIAHSRLVALISGGLGTLLLVAPALMHPRLLRPSRSVVVIAIVAGVAMAVQAWRPWRAEARAEWSRIASTSLTPITIHLDTRVVPEPKAIGGAIARFGPGVLLVTGSGEWYNVVWDSTGQHLQAASLELPAAMSRDGVPADLAHPPHMRVTGLAVDERGDSASVWIVHEVWEPVERCVALQVSTMRLHQMRATESSWRRVYRTQPCIAPPEGFEPYDSGGRLTILRDGSLVLTVGDYGIYEGADGAVAQQPEGDYGKTLLIRPDGSRTLHTMGHRNPAGLTMDRDGNLWVAEHGPRGGDELNLLRPGANYGWPLATYGTDYGAFRWHLEPPPGNSFVEPAMVLVPGVAISSVIAVEGQLFEPWAGDLLAGALAGRQLLRIRRAGSRVIYAEPIPLTVRVRDLVETRDGRIVIWDDGGDMVWLAPATDFRDEVVAYQPCIRCHDAIDEGDSRFGPPLGGIVGRRVASNEDFQYSDALKGVGGRWTEDRLDSFLKSPATFAPGTRMAFPGIADSATRKALIVFLRRSVLVREH
jgi:glucose/arabinose dehydrogenase/cytochrome c2